MRVSALRLSALCASLLAFTALPSTAAATSGKGEVDAAVNAAVQYVRALQDPASGEVLGFENGALGSDWAATALAAAGVSAADLHGSSPGAPSFQDFLLGQYASGLWTGDPTGAVTNYERATLVAFAAGLDPARLSADSNLPAQIAGRWNAAAGSFGQPSARSTAFAILALRTAPVPAWALAPAVAFLRRAQHEDGGWAEAADPGAEPSNPEDTGAAVAALCEAGAPAYDPAVAAGLAYLQGQEDTTTGAILFGPSANAEATARALSALNACGIDPQSSPWTTATGRTPVDYLLTLQVAAGPEAGGFAFESPAAEPANVYSTAEALRALAGGVFTARPPSPADPPGASVQPAPAVAPGTPVPHLLAIQLSPGNVRICKLTAPAGAPLPQVLDAAKAESFPAGCVTSLSFAGGRLESLDGVAPEGEGEAWLVRLDRSAEGPAAGQPVGFGEAIALRVGASPGAGQGPAGPPGPAGVPGPTGAPGPVSRHRCARRRHGRRHRPARRSPAAGAGLERGAKPVGRRACRR